jgi:HSP20 family molecular chaperone IbpA
MTYEESKTNTIEMNGSGQQVPIEQGGIFDQIDRMWRRVAERAFQIFEERGKHHGHDLDDWLAAEHELLASMPIEIIEKADKLVVRAQIPGFSGENLRVTLEPEKLVIKGRPKETKPGDKDEDWEFFRPVDLPSNIEVESATAMLTGNVLVIELNKLERAPASEKSHGVTA